MCVSFCVLSPCFCVASEPCVMSPRWERMGEGKENISMLGRARPAPLLLLLTWHGNYPGRRRRKLRELVDVHHVVGPQGQG